MDHGISTRPPSLQRRTGLKSPAKLTIAMVETGRYCLIDGGTMYRKARPKGEGLVPGTVATGVHATGQIVHCGVDLPRLARMLEVPGSKL